MLESRLGVSALGLSALLAADALLVSMVWTKWLKLMLKCSPQIVMRSCF